jgi:hypothetical protein
VFNADLSPGGILLTNVIPDNNNILIVFIISDAAIVFTLEEYVLMVMEAIESEIDRRSSAISLYEVDGRYIPAPRSTDITLAS